MTISMPAIISRYLDASDRRDADAAVACFTEDAVVTDEDKEWHGHAGIRRWRTTLATAYEYTVEVRGARALGEVDGVERVDVYSHLEGNFPGGTVDLTQSQLDTVAEVRYRVWKGLSIEGGAAFSYFVQHELSHEDNNYIQLSTLGAIIGARYVF